MTKTFPVDDNKQTKIQISFCFHYLPFLQSIQLISKIVYNQKFTTLAEQSITVSNQVF